jgi:hypothetical protein
MNTYSKQYTTYHSISLIFGAGARCRTCTRLFSVNRDLPPGFCAAHEFGITSEEAALGRLAVELQDILFARRTLTWRNAGRKEVPWFPGWTASEHWSWKTVNMFWSECEWSHIVLSPVWQWYLSHQYTGREWK